jgi:hypothetical protein
MQTATPRRTPIGAILMILGGVIAAVGSFMTWANVTVSDVSASAKGTDGSDGYITLVAGIVLVLLGAVALRAGKRPLAILAILAGGIAAGVGIYDAATAEDSVLDAVAEQVAPQVGASVPAVREILQQSADNGDLDIQIQIGLYLVIAGGALGLLGGVIGLISGGSDRGEVTTTGMPADPSTSMPTSPPPGWATDTSLPPTSEPSPMPPPAPGGAPPPPPPSEPTTEP